MTSPKVALFLMNTDVGLLVNTNLDCYQKSGHPNVMTQGRIR